MRSIGPREKSRKAKGLVWRISVIVDEIAAHPPDFTELFVFVAREGIKVTIIEIRVVVLVVGCGGLVGVERRAEGESFEDVIHCELEYVGQLENYRMVRAAYVRSPAWGRL